MMRILTRATISGAVLVLLLAGCDGRSVSPDPSPAETSHIQVTLPPPDPGVHLTLVQQRLDEGTRRVGLRVANITRRALRVREVGLDWSGYGSFTRPTDSTVAPGATIDLPFTLPRERCHADVTTTPVGVAVTGTETIRDDVDDMGARFAERLWRTGCMTTRLHRAATFSYGPIRQVRATGPSAAVRTSLHIKRTAGHQEISVVDTQGSVLFDLRLGRPSRLEGRQREGRPPAEHHPWTL